HPAGVSHKHPEPLSRQPFAVPDVLDRRRHRAHHPDRPGSCAVDRYRAGLEYIMSISIIVRPLASPAEYEMHFQFADQAFSSDPSQTNARFWQQVTTSRPDFRPEQLRGAFRDGEQLGSYILHERVLRMGAARLATGCIG